MPGLDSLGSKPLAPLPSAPRAAAAPAAPSAAGPALEADGLRLSGVSAVGGTGPRTSTLPWVKAEGTKLVDETGKQVHVRGFNLGGWLIQEPWMLPLAGKPPVKDEYTLWKTLEDRFGTTQMVEIREQYRSAFLGEVDFAKMQETGVTTVRLPFTYDSLMEPGGFEKLDWAIDQAAKHGMYTVLDLHGAPGGQSKEMHTGRADVNEFFTKPENVQKAADLWRKIAERYKDRPEVIGYDLLNEPMGAKNAKILHEAHDVLYKAIREVDRKHVVMMEDGYKGIATIPDPKKYGWENVAFSVHQYNFNGKNTDAHLKSLDGMMSAIERTERAKNVPVYMGEFGVPGADKAMLNRFVKKLGENDVDWTMWNYKGVFGWGGEGNSWAMVHNKDGLEKLDVHQDSPEELLRKISAFKTEKLFTGQSIVDTLKQEAALAGTRPAKTHSAFSNFLNQVVDTVMTGAMTVADRVRGFFGIAL